MVRNRDGLEKRGELLYPGYLLETSLFIVLNSGFYGKSSRFSHFLITRRECITL